MDLKLYFHVTKYILSSLNLDRHAPKCYVLKKTVTTTKKLITWILVVITTSHTKINKNQLKFNFIKYRQYHFLNSYLSTWHKVLKGLSLNLTSNIKHI